MKCTCGHEVEEHGDYVGCMHTKGNEKIGFVYCNCRKKHSSFTGDKNNG